jgi:circadian clock protein KaiC
VELEELMTRMKDQIRQIRPARIVIDSVAELRLMAEGPLRYRREMMRLKQFLASSRSTVLLLEEATAESSLRTFADGVILLEQLAPRVRVGTTAFVDHQGQGQNVCRRVP